ncbi:hypothetical protein D3C71_1782180 [compost metagenome]
MYPDATGLGDGRIEQVGADGSCRADAKPQQDRGHQRAATDAGHPDDETHDQARNGETERTYIHTLLDCPTLPVIGCSQHIDFFIAK